MQTTYGHGTASDRMDVGPAAMAGMVAASETPFQAPKVSLGATRDNACMEAPAVYDVYLRD